MRGQGSRNCPSAIVRNDARAKAPCNANRTKVTVSQAANRTPGAFLRDLREHRVTTAEQAQIHKHRRLAARGCQGPSHLISDVRR
jgi:hypothetical protein